MAEPCCGDPGVRPDHFHCHRCGHCCTNLTDRWDDGRHADRFQALGQTPIYRVPTPGGLRMFSWEAPPFPAENLVPMLVLLDKQRERPVALAYELQAKRCPRYDEDSGCTIYDQRPMVCKAYPLLVVQGEGGPSVAVSEPCPGKVPVLGAVQATSEPERVLFGLYPGEAGAALAVPALVNHLTELVGFLASAGVIDPVDDADDATMDPWLETEALDLVELVEDEGVMTREDLVDRGERIVEVLRERWLG